MRADREISLEEWLKHDAWSRESCAHSGRLIGKRLGNIALIGHVGLFLEGQPSIQFSLIRARVVYEGAHTGDWIPAAFATELLEEARMLQRASSDPIVARFAAALTELSEASVAIGNPVVF